MEQNESGFFNPVPLIPPLEKPTCPDTSHIIREEFQKIIGADQFPQVIAKALVNNQIENQYLLQCGLETIRTTEDLKASEEEITHAELCLMKSQAQYIVETSNKEVNKNTSISGKIYPAIDPDIINKFSLLQTDDILPYVYQRILNNNLSPFNFIYEDACLKLEASDDFTKCCGEPNRNLTDAQKRQLKSLRKAERYLKFKNIDDPGLRADYFHQVVFDVHPKQIVFEDFELFRTYEKKLYLKNKTNHLQHIIMPAIKKPSVFYIQANKSDPRVAPGMCFSFTIGFKPELVENSYEHLVIRIVGSKPIHIDISTNKKMPFLKGLVYHKEFMEGNISIDKIKNAIYNYTVDCGTVLYGCRSECNFILQNTGGISRFFLCTEQDWYNRHITCVTDTYKLILPDFKIWPAFFLLRQNEMCDLKFEFTPTDEGLLVDKLFLLSDNNNVEEIDIIGDCIYYEPGFFTFQIPECPTTPFKGENEIKNVLHLGAVYYEQVILGHFYMYNKSLISIPFECRTEELVDNNTFRCIKKDWVKIRPEYGTILPLSGERFEVSVKMQSKQIGLYKFNLNIFAIDIPEMSLMEGPVFTFGEEYRSKDLKQKLLTILSDRIEVQIHHIKLPVRVYPEIIDFPKLIYKTVGTMSHIQVVNDGFCCLQFNWLQKKHNNSKIKIKVKPNHFQIEAMQHVSCSVYVKLKTYDDVDETLTLSVNNGYYEKNIRIKGKVEKPKLKVAKSFINFGHVRIQSNITNVFTITNSSETCLCWEVKEFQYNYVIHKFIEADNSCLSQVCGELCQTDNETQIVYKLDTSVPKKFFSILIFFTIYKYEKFESTHVFLLGYIHEPKVSLRTMTMSGTDIFKIEDIYYVNESITKTLELHNDSLVEAHYGWGESSGFHTKHLKYSFDYNKGVLFPNSRRHVNITLILKKPGIIFDFYIPCYIQHTPEPLILQILCVIKKPQVIFIIPGISELTEVAWPADYEPFSEISGEGPPDQQLITMDSVSKSLDFGDSASTPSIGMQCGGTTWNLNNIFEYLHKIEMTGEQKSIHEKTSSDTTVCTSIISEVQSQFGLFSKFASESSICEYAIYFLNVKCKEVSTKTLKIRNPMSCPLKYSITIKHFKTKDYKRKRLEDIYIKLNWKHDDSYSKQLSDHGILVMVDPQSGVLTNDWDVAISVSVYAETWGYYLEEISVEIEEIPTFCMNIIIQVVGQPVEIPMMPTTEGHIWFSNIQKCTFEQIRKVTLYNNSTIPCLIVWHIFLKPKNKIDNDDLFNIVYDIFDFDDEPQAAGNIKLIKYMGEEIPSHFKFFSVEPTELHLQPKQTRQITVSFRPNLYTEAEVDISNIGATLIGNIYIEKKYSNLNFLIRNASKDLQLINIPIKTAIESALLNFQCVRGNAHISININDILNGDLKYKNIILVFHNDCKSDITVSMNITEPFEITSLRSRIGGNNKLYNNKIRTPVLRNGHLEATIKCEILHCYLLNIADVLYKKVNHYLKGLQIITTNSVRISRILKIKHFCDDPQVLPVSVTLYFPLIEVSTENLDFGDVCLNSRRHMTFKVLNKTASKTWIEIEFLNEATEFKVDQLSGYLEPHTIFPKSFYITVTFTPSNNKPVENIMRVKTKIPQYYIDVIVTGVGTYDEKYFYESNPTYKCIQFHENSV